MMVACRFSLTLLLALLLESVGSFVILSPRTSRSVITAYYHPPTSEINDIEVENIDERLLNIAKKLKLDAYDLEEGIYGFDSLDPRYGIEIIQTSVDVSDGQGIGLELTELAHGRKDDRGLVLISDVTGNAANKATLPIHIGDTITGVHNSDYSVREPTIDLNYERTVEAINKVKEAALKKDGKLSLQLNRVVKRASIQVQVDDGSGKIQTIDDALAGENLRRLLLRKDLKLYDAKTKRFDQPYATGNCAGDGLCGTCLVAVTEGMELLNEKDYNEKLITQGRPPHWRAACRMVIGANNKAGTIKIRTHPQSRFEQELDPGVRSLKP